MFPILKTNYTNILQSQFVRNFPCSHWKVCRCIQNPFHRQR